MIRYNDDGSLTHGTFDDLSTLVRWRYEDGVPKNVISKMWVETDDREAFNRLEPWMQQPWGSYPNIPPRLKRK